MSIKKLSSESVCYFHDWMNSMRGGERVLEALTDFFPDAPIYTLFHEREHLSQKLQSKKIIESSIAKWPSVHKNYRYYLPMMPWAIQDLSQKLPSQTELILSSSHCVAKGLKKPKNAFHIAYVHAPMRYIWDRFDEYFGWGRASFLTCVAARIARPFLQDWDRETSQIHNVDLMIANSRFIASMIKLAYGREAEVIYPFYDENRFQESYAKQDYFAYFGALTPNKRPDIALRAAIALGLKVRVAGAGSERKKLEKEFGTKVEFLSYLSDEEVPRFLGSARGLLFPGVEDFGITPLEAMAVGTPVIARAAGGALETVREGVSGVLGTVRGSQDYYDLLKRFLFLEKNWDYRATQESVKPFSKKEFDLKWNRILSRFL